VGLIQTQQKALAPRASAFFTEKENSGIVTPSMPLFSYFEREIFALTALVGNFMVVLYPISPHLLRTYNY